MPVPIVYQNFVPPAIDAGNLNTVNNVVYTVIGDGTNAPLNAANVRTNIGLGTMATQNAGAVNITGGTLTGVTVSGTVTGTATGSLIATRYFTSGGTYTPTAGTGSIIVDAIGGGGGGGGGAATGVGTMSAGGGGGSGTWGRKRITSGFSGQTITVGTGGAGGFGTAGVAGTTSSFGALLVCPGGTGGTFGGAIGVAVSSPSGATGAPATGADISITGSGGDPGFNLAVNNSISGMGAGSCLGTGSPSAFSNSAAVFPGFTAQGFGAGGSGSCSGQSAGAGTGGAGSPGIVIIYEYA